MAVSSIGTSRILASGVAALLCACGGDDDSGASSTPQTLCAARDVPVQGSPAADPTAAMDVSCLGTPPVQDCNALKFCGKSTRILFPTPIDAATYEFFDAQGKSLAKKTTDDEGAYCATVRITDVGFDGRISLSKAGYRTHDAYLGAQPWGWSHDALTLGIEKEADLVNLLPAFGAPAPDPAKGIVDPFILACAMHYLPPVAVEIDRPYEKRLYLGAGGKLVPDAPGSAAGQLSGALFVNVEPGPVVATFRLLDANDQPGDVVGTSSGEVTAGRWTALPAYPTGP